MSQASVQFFKLVAKPSGKVIEIIRGLQKKGASLQPAEYTGSEHQKFLLFSTAADQNEWFIIAKHSGKVLEVFDNNQENEAILQQSDYNGKDNQKFIVEPVEDGYFRIMAKQNGKSVFLLEKPESSKKASKNSQTGQIIVQQEKKHPDEHQQFQLTAVEQLFFNSIPCKVYCTLHQLGEGVFWKFNSNGEL